MTSLLSARALRVLCAALWPGRAVSPFFSLTMRKSLARKYVSRVAAAVILPIFIAGRIISFRRTRILQNLPYRDIRLMISSISLSSTVLSTMRRPRGSFFVMGVVNRSLICFWPSVRRRGMKYASQQKF